MAYLGGLSPPGEYGIPYLNMSTNPNSSRRPGFHACACLPLTSIFATIGSVLLAGVSVMILYFPDEHLTKDWPSRHLDSPFPPSVLLAALAVLSNSLLRFALSEAQLIFWWRKALQPDGATIHSL